MLSTSVVDTPEGPEDILRRRPMVQPQPQQNSVETIPIQSAAKPDKLIPNTPLAASSISFLLGSLLSLGLVVFAAGGLNRVITYQLGFFLAAWAIFHWLEFAVTAGWNREKCSVDSFLLENGQQYHIAHAVAISEHIVTAWFRPSWKAFPYVSVVGIALVVVAQALRSIAMVHATTNFSHTVAWRKRDAHTLVTDGIYRWSRHPSYAGFFYWALGTQLVLQNPISFVAYLVALFRFFRDRIKYEEEALVRFFGNDYIEYRKTVGTQIPFIP